MNKAKISFIIVNYNTEKYVEHCLNSIYSQKLPFEFEVIVADNNSPQRSIELLPAKFPDAAFLFLKFNGGFGYGCNEGAKKAEGDYLVFLNPDTELIDDSIKNMLEFMESNNLAGACTGLLLEEENLKAAYSFNDFPDLLWEFKQATGIGLMKKINSLNDSEEIKSGKPFEIDWAHGAFLMIKKSVFQMVNGFDEKIFLYFEDTDLQKRIQLSGYRNYCIPESRVIHHTQSSIKEEKLKRTYYYNMNISRLYYMNKYWTLIPVLLARIFYIFGSLLKMIKLIFQSQNMKSKIDRMKEHLIVIKIYLLKFNVTDTR